MPGAALDRVGGRVDAVDGRPRDNALPVRAWRGAARAPYRGLPAGLGPEDPGRSAGDAVDTLPLAGGGPAPEGQLRGPPAGISEPTGHRYTGRVWTDQEVALVEVALDRSAALRPFLPRLTIKWIVEQPEQRVQAIDGT